MQNAVDFLKSAAARVRQLANAAPELAERLSALADELEGEARALETGDHPDQQAPPTP